jgi:NAD(P)-dependent dehydrogenase (short-subunit alcohol dehydrogenase family)
MATVMPPISEKGPSGKLLKKVAVVTGASRGIGRAIALAYAVEGADVAVAARASDPLDSVADEIRAAGRRAIVVPTDVSDSGQVDALVERAISELGGIDILVNNAGAFKEVATVPFPDRVLRPPAVMRDSTERMTDAEFHEVIDTNIGGVFYGCRAVAPHMMEQGYGKIINISSVAAVKAFKLEAVYDASKAAVNMLTRTLALEWAPYGVRVNGLAPGDYNTAMTAGAWANPVRRQAYLDSIPLGAEGDMAGLGALAVFLASADSDYITGQTINIDGGLSAE